MIELQKILDEELPKDYKWLQVNKLYLNTDKTVYQIYNTKKNDVHLNITLVGSIIKHVNTVKYLGVIIDENMKWESHIVHISRIASLATILELSIDQEIFLAKITENDFIMRWFFPISITAASYGELSQNRSYTN